MARSCDGCRPLLESLEAERDEARAQLRVRTYELAEEKRRIEGLREELRQARARLTERTAREAGLWSPDLDRVDAGDGSPAFFPRMRPPAFAAPEARPIPALPALPHVEEPTRPEPQPVDRWLEIE